MIVSSAKKTDRHDVYTIAMFLSRDLIPESYLCDQGTEELRKLLSERSDLVTAMVKAKNKIHALMRGYWMKTVSSQFQSEKKRQQLLIGLENHPLYTEHAAKTLEMLLDTLELLTMSRR